MKVPNWKKNLTWDWSMHIPPNIVVQVPMVTEMPMLFKACVTRSKRSSAQVVACGDLACV
eukprot:CAMPEP_0180784186 /NCGR_PEP_ID=MMETSP1038_2-20121128/49458_1 /TAXON_ID=632150 /ORGANISM="Azadinium spinosum, Strain 3D9" /LENGTH=59 /DNA_ID=CAMNT_0022820875 /DNA_START=89 /DNA_END=268 /DNA_ORIENTATION=-